MKPSTQTFIQETLAIVLAGIFLLGFFGGLGYMTYKDTMQKKEMYLKCIDTCERVFQEQKLIECMQTCNDMNKNKQEKNVSINDGE